MFRNWVEESYFQPVGQRTLSNQALYQNKNVIVIYSSIRSGTIKMINYVKNRAVAVATEIKDGLNYQTDNGTHSNLEFMNKQEIQSCSSSSSSTENYKLTELKKPSDIKIAISEKEDFEHELLNCGFNLSGMFNV